MVRPVIFSLLALLGGAAAILPDGTCYFPDGLQAVGYLPCNRTIEYTSCCQTGWTCMSSGLCVVTDKVDFTNLTEPIGTTMRGACTNPQWDNAVCGTACLAPNPNVNGSLTACGNNKFCCNSDILSNTCNCDTGVGVSSIDPGIPQTIIGAIGLIHTATSIVSPSSAVPTPTSGQTTATSSSAPSSAASSSSNASGSKISKGAIAGIAVGSAIALTLIIGGILCYLRRQKGKSRPNSLSSNSTHLSVPQSQPVAERPFHEETPIFIGNPEAGTSGAGDRRRSSRYGGGGGTLEAFDEASRSSTPRAGASRRGIGLTDSRSMSSFGGGGPPPLMSASDISRDTLGSRASPDQARRNRASRGTLYSTTR